MSKPKKIILCPNPYRDKDMTVAARSKEILDQEGFETVVCLPFQKEGYGAELGVPIQQLDREIKRADLLIAFGGDGTILHLAKTLAMNRVPVLGINLGSLGFMSELEPDELERLRDLKNWNLSIEDRMMLDVSVVRDGRTVYNTIALNDAVISKGSIARVVRLEIYTEEGFLTWVGGDGVVMVPSPPKAMSRRRCRDLYAYRPHRLLHGHRRPHCGAHGPEHSHQPHLPAFHPFQQLCAGPVPCDSCEGPGCQQEIRIPFLRWRQGLFPEKQRHGAGKALQPLYEAGAPVKKELLRDPG